MLFLYLTAWLVLASPSLGQDWTTSFEKSGGVRTPDYAETIAYCRRLADASPWVHYTTFGTSPQGRDLVLLVCDKDGHRTPEEVRRSTSNKAVVLIQAGIHAGEIDGKDAGLMLIRDIAIHKTRAALLDHVTILFMPIFNVDGHERTSPYNRANQKGPVETGWRTTARGLNLNRDYLKADAPEMQDWLRLYTRWLPEFLVDCHVTDGADYQYVVTYAMENLGSMDAELTQWINGRFLGPLTDRMAAAGQPIIRYNSYRAHNEPTSGIVCWASPPRFSTGYAAIQNRPAILIETHMFKDYKTRVEGTYVTLVHTLEILNEEHERVRKLIRDADARTASPELRAAPFPLSFRSTPDSVMIDFLGYEYEVVESDLTGGKWHRFSDRPVTMHIPMFNRLEADVVVTLPEAYVVPAEWKDVIDRLALHGVKMERLRSDCDIDVVSWRIDEPQWPDSPHEGRFPVTFKSREITEKRTYPAGSAVVDMNQRAARVAAHALEPDGPDSFLRWGFFDSIFEQKEYIEPYVLEELARRMLAEDPGLRRKLDELKASDQEFARSPERIRHWLYQHSPYWDDRIGVYPVGKIVDRQLLKQLPR
jgi:hypothetical protein